ncbi:sporulation protein [Streptomyces sp. NRRL B-1677]|uniref:sporulation protein n=1 Tax=Streptomyces sp. NRRL B-1677 TaxID=2682966 RepID=UPI0018929DE9|nr:sporulation protein [Streptomyces sp. NRRL B-1677]MBF6047307.1 sporulation protein [Streptomyces sp. NRRL B-1677]
MAKTIGREPNARLEKLIAESGISHKRLAYRVNQICLAEGVASEYTHTSVVNWSRRGMRPRWPVPRHLCTVLAEGLGRPVDLADIGMEDMREGGRNRSAGLAFPRDQRQALAEAASYWSTVNRRTFLAATPFAVASFSEPVTRWLVSPTETVLPSSGTAVLGRAHIEELRAVADDARTWDSRFGGAALKSHALTAYLDERVSPLLRARYSERNGRDLFSVTAEMARLAGWTAFDSGQHQAAQRHFIQALRLAKAAGDIHLGSYVLTTMAMQSLMRGFASQAVDMAQGAFERVPGADPRVLGFAKLIEARAHAREGDARSACAALAMAERFQERGAAEGAGGERAWIGFFNRQRIVTDATEIFRDLGRPKSTFAWHALGSMPGEAFARSRGIRLSVLATAHAQQGDLDAGLLLGQQSLRLFTRLRTARGLDYLQIFTDALRPWRREPSVMAYVTQVKGLASSLAG